jgi:uncharacterized protein (TIRG00374 family)
MLMAGVVAVEHRVGVDLHSVVQLPALRRTLQITSVTLLTILFLGLFLWNSNLRDVWRIMKATDPLWFAGGLLINFGAIIFRTIRWRALLDFDRPPAFYPTFFATATGYMLSTVLPIRASDVARPALLSRRTNVRFATALGTVLTERILDLISIVALFLFYCFTHWSAFDEGRAVLRGGAVGSSIVLGALLVLMAGIFFLRSSFRRIHETIGRILPKRFREAWMNFFDSFSRSLEITKHPRALLQVLVATAGIWFCLTAQFWFVLVAAHRPLPYDASFFIGGVTTVGIAIPTPGGVGGFHKVCQYVLTTFYRFDIDSSVAVAVLFHLVGTIPVVVTGLLLFLREGLNWKQLTQETSGADES